LVSNPMATFGTILETLSRSPTGESSTKQNRHKGTSLNRSPACQRTATMTRGKETCFARSEGCCSDATTTTESSSNKRGMKRQRDNRRCQRREPTTTGLGVAALTLQLLVLFVVTLSKTPATARRIPWSGRPSTSLFMMPTKPSLESTNLQSQSAAALALRGGDQTSDDSENDSDNDEERYSRQVYTMGARAHGLIRSSTIYVDGPIRSGLLWESIKNLALSGVGGIVVVVSDDDSNDENDNYHEPALDDLGGTYIRGAMAELGEDDNVSRSSNELVDLLVEFLRRLNPAMRVSTVSKTELLLESKPDGHAQQQQQHEGGVLLCVDRPYRQQLEWNEFCRKSPSSSLAWKFVSAETAGVYGRIFCDFGPRHEIHDADGETPLVVPLDRVEGPGGSSNENDQTILVKSVEGEKHDVSRDDVVVFSRSDGSFLEELRCIVTRVETPERIRVRLAATTDADVDETSKSVESAIATINAEAVAFARQKQIEEVSFRSLGEATRGAIDGSVSDVFTPCDLDKSFDETRRSAVFGSFQALGSFVRAHGRIPRYPEGGDSFQELAREACGKGEGANEDEDDEEWQHHCHNFLQTCAAKFVPLQAIFGAVASQECLKAVSGLYNPVRQFLLYDCDEVLASDNDGGEKTCAAHTDGLSHILGSEAVARLRNQKLFVVGSGAIGCEILKNIAAMGLGTGKEGTVLVTDMDTIEKSNLSRQLLFRDDDIGKFKSRAAEEAMRRMNPSVAVECHTSKVGDEEDPGPFDSRFWSRGVDVVLNALDNMEARLFMDGQCVANQKALVDAGTLGSKGNVQVVVPHQSESYGSSADPPEPAIPVCTLKNFPYAISHTIQWGRDLFDGLFVRRPQQANQYAQLYVDEGIEGLTNKLDQELGDEAAFEAARELAEDLLIMEDEGAVDDGVFMEKKAIEWAIDLGRELFRDAIEELLLEHPIDKLDEDEEPFWSGSRKPPQPLSFSLTTNNEAEDDATKQKEEINKNMVDFVRSAARLRYETYTGIPSNSRENSRLVPTEKAKNALIGAAESSPSFQKTTPASTEEVSETSKRSEIKGLLAPLDSRSSNDAGASLRSLSAAEFEKDDDSNDHIAFITAASNLRAICYGIAPVDAMETRKVAGKIVPAMITTTAFVSALSCIELVKLTQKAPLNRHRNAFINLALPFFAFTSPLPAEEFTGVRGETHTLWDRISIKEGKKAAQAGGLTLRRLLRRIQKKAYAEDPDAIQVSNISIGPIMIYANFLHEDDEDLLNKSIWEVIQEAVQSGEEFDAEFSRDGPADNEESKGFSSISSASFVDLAVSVEDTETYEEVELPQVRLFRS